MQWKGESPNCCYAFNASGCLLVSSFPLFWTGWAVPSRCKLFRVVHFQHQLGRRQMQHTDFLISPCLLYLMHLSAFSDATYICPTDYINQIGGFSWQNTLFISQVTSCNDCARQCDSYGRSCAVYECSPTELLCAGFQSSSTLLTIKYTDYQVCKKDFTGEHFERHSFSVFECRTFFEIRITLTVHCTFSSSLLEHLFVQSH